MGSSGCLNCALESVLTRFWLRLDHLADDAATVDLAQPLVNALPVEYVQTAKCPQILVLNEFHLTDCALERVSAYGLAIFLGLLTLFLHFEALCGQVFKLLLVQEWCTPYA